MARYFAGRRSFAGPAGVRTVNRAAHIETLDMQTLGLLVSRAAACGVPTKDFRRFAHNALSGLLAMLDAHPVSLEERLARAAARYEFR